MRTLEKESNGSEVSLLARGREGKGGALTIKGREGEKRRATKEVDQ
jgi:hypothetical protein